MEKKIFLFSLITILASLFFIQACTDKNLRSQEAPDDYRKADIKLGGLLYDNWLNVVNARVNGNHPAYPPSAKKSGSSTWRCKECHGWDYIGKDGRYSKGSHYTGIKGVYNSRTRSPKDLYGIMTGSMPDHSFSGYLSDGQTWALVKFIREGLTDMSAALNPDGSGKGSPFAGKPLYETHCADCHGSDGKELDFKSKSDGIQGVGWLSNDNPQETLHKIRWGHPGSDMPSGVMDMNLTDTDITDLFTYTRGLK